MQVTLTVLSGVHRGRDIPLRVREFVIGREAGCQLRPLSTDVAPRHCAIIQRDNRVFLKDLGSANGTVVNHRLLVGGELQLIDGDRVEVGPLAFQVTLTPHPVLSADTAHELHMTESGAGQKADDTVLTHTPVTPPPPARKPADEQEVICF